MNKPYSDSLSELGWTVDDKGLSAYKHYRFRDFVAAFVFMTVIAKEAERLGHHPDWRNVYCDVWVTLTTHDTGGLTHLDVSLARACDEHVVELSEE